jgi:hypothetical protein
MVLKGLPACKLFDSILRNPDQVINRLDFSFQLARGVGKLLSGPELQVTFIVANSHVVCISRPGKG